MSKQATSTQEVLVRLRDPSTIRSQSQRLYALAKQDKLTHFSVNLERMEPTAHYIIEVIRGNYPDLNIPYHSRWRHFSSGGIDRIQAMHTSLGIMSDEAWGAILYELVIISVLLDAGAGSSWQYLDPLTNARYTRSEGLALASLALYQSGLLSADPQHPHRVDAKRLQALTEDDLMHAFQVCDTNPLEGVSGRVALLHQLGAVLLKNKRYFGTEGRLGAFYQYVRSLQQNHSLPAALLFQAVLSAFEDIWPNRLKYHGMPLGDVWMHKALKTEVEGSEYIPFHKLSQWLTYSLIEPLEQTGVAVTDLDILTGLPEYRNGGLFVDTGVLVVKNKTLLQEPQAPDSEAIIEWRGLTVALLDEHAVLIRAVLNQNSSTLPLAKILQGGTWEAGRKIAREKRPLGTPPIQIISDGTLF